MRIESQKSQLPEALPEANASAARQAATPSLAKQPAAAPVAATRVASSEQPYLKAALAANPMNQDAIAQASRLLASGELDTAEAALRAAQAMLDGK